MVHTEFHKKKQKQRKEKRAAKKEEKKGEAFTPKPIDTTAPFIEQRLEQTLAPIQTTAPTPEKETRAQKQQKREDLFRKTTDIPGQKLSPAQKESRRKELREKGELTDALVGGEKSFPRAGLEPVTAAKETRGEDVDFLKGVDVKDIQQPGAPSDPKNIRVTAEGDRFDITKQLTEKDFRSLESAKQARDIAKTGGGLLASGKVATKKAQAKIERIGKVEELKALREERAGEEEEPVEEPIDDIQARKAELEAEGLSPQEVIRTLSEEGRERDKARFQELKEQPGIAGALAIDPDVDVLGRENIGKTLEAFGGAVAPGLGRAFGAIGRGAGAGRTVKGVQVSSQTIQKTRQAKAITKTLKGNRIKTLIKNNPLFSYGIGAFGLSKVVSYPTKRAKGIEGAAGKLGEKITKRFELVRKGGDATEVQKEYRVMRQDLNDYQVTLNKLRRFNPELIFNPEVVDSADREVAKLIAELDAAEQGLDVLIATPIDPNVEELALLEEDLEKEEH